MYNFYFLFFSQALENEFKKPYFQKLNDFILQDGNNKTIFPKHEDIWSWTMHTSIEDIRVVILGQDPYHGPGQVYVLMVRQTSRCIYS